MKVLIGQFVTESNANIPTKTNITNYDIVFGDEVTKKMKVQDIFEDRNIEVIPSILAVSGASGVIERNAFDYIESCFLNTIEKHKHELDGIYLMLHGASEVEGLGSGDHHIIQEIRKIVGEYLPIAVSCDPHGNLSQEYVDSLNILRTYRESPHTDAVETWRHTAKLLCDLLEDRQNIKPVYRKLPMILGGEQSVSIDEPVKTINKYLDELEADPRIMSSSWHVGYLRHDTHVAGCGIVVVPSRGEYTDYAEEVADTLAKYVWDKRHEFHYTGHTAQPDVALKEALEYIGKPVVITDSGDNTTSGATGWNTYILRQALAVKKLDKTFLFAAITDPRAVSILRDLEIGASTTLKLGVDYDELSKAVEVEVVVKSKGDVVRPIGIGATDLDTCKVFGYSVTVNIKGTSIDVIVSNVRESYKHNIQFEVAGVQWTSYDVVIVKQGYIFPELKEKAAFYIMSLTAGATPQDTKNIPFKTIMRPMFPIDEI